MTDKQKLQALKVRENLLKGRADKNVDSPGVLRKIQRKIRNLEKGLN